MDMLEKLEDYEVVKRLAEELAVIAGLMKRGKKISDNNLTFAIQQCDTVKRILNELK